MLAKMWDLASSPWIPSCGGGVGGNGICKVVGMVSWLLSFSPVTAVPFFLAPAWSSSCPGREAGEQVSMVLSWFLLARLTLLGAEVCVPGGRRGQSRPATRRPAAAGEVEEGGGRHLSGGRGDPSLAEEGRPHQLSCGLCPPPPPAGSPLSLVDG